MTFFTDWIRTKVQQLENNHRQIESSLFYTFWLWLLRNILLNFQMWTTKNAMLKPFKDKQENCWEKKQQIVQSKTINNS